jgi:6-phosphofructokinase 1
MSSAMVEAADLRVRTLGECRIGSPLGGLVTRRGTTEHYVDEADRVLFDDTLAMLASRDGEPPSFEPGGPRREIFFDPSKIRVGIVTCGGLCPGLNDVIRGLVLELTSHYGDRTTSPRRAPTPPATSASATSASTCDAASWTTSPPPAKRPT